MTIYTRTLRAAAILTVLCSGIAVVGATYGEPDKIEYGPIQGGQR